MSARTLPDAAYSPRQIARMLNVGKDTVYAAIERGEIPADRFGKRYCIPAWWINQRLNGPEEVTP